jgi:flagellar hook-associated protein 1 FlgK
VPTGVTITDENGVEYTAGQTITILDEENCSYGVDGELPPRELFVRGSTARYTKATDKSGNIYYIYNKENPDDDTSRYAIGNVTTNKELQHQITLMPAYKANGDVDYDMGAKLAAAWENTDLTLNPTDKNPCTFEGYYNKMVEALAIEGNTYTAEVSTLESSLESYDNARQQSMGVSSDEELTQMIKYQAAYNAASRYMTVISEMTELIVTGLV